MSAVEEAVQLAKLGMKAEAQKILESHLHDHPTDTPAWFWYIETLPSLSTRVRALQECLKYNPDCQQASQALESLNHELPEGADNSSLSRQAEQNMPVESEKPAWLEALQPAIPIDAQAEPASVVEPAENSLLPAAALIKKKKAVTAGLNILSGTLFTLCGLGLLYWINRLASGIGGVFLLAWGIVVFGGLSILAGLLGSFRLNPPSP